MSHIARKRFGQNFLHDQSVISQIIASVHAQANEHWVEIGPGQGALTVPLLKQGLKLEVVELDRDLVALLEQKLGHYPQLTIHSADALRFDFASLAAQGEKLRVIGNLPYNISTPLMFHLLTNSACFQDMHFMLQREVVERICAEPGSKDYGRLSVMMQYYCQPSCLFLVAPESFHPVPKVTSAIIRLIPHQQPPVNASPIKLNRIVTEAFAQRRKTLRNSLKKLITEQQIEAVNIDPNCRAETLSLADFAALSGYL